ncbi:SPRY domain containing protein [Metarhizium album ARSEF 1941]|uniref:SPRY domain containing protein n=1 Tax=Metarhizium album (strain ARSEF 1941) TaxID=1081103 RepID=A0A0B2WKS9_METAS|nr:SPRY domain containing protein [Metarhizium album ARSEF 1941]KHN96666.1 SPRY domain containing protein [Metarhizium album ARSEF 1941]
MASLEQHGSSGFSDSDSSAGSPGRPQSRNAATYTPDPPRRSGLGSHFFTHPSRTSILSPSGGLLLDPVPGLVSATSRADNNNLHDSGLHDVATMWKTSGTLPSFSRGFDMFMAPMYPESSESSSKDHDAFFVPSYLSESTYVHKLEAAHRSKLQARREAVKQHNQEMATGLARSQTGLRMYPTSVGTRPHTGLERPGWPKLEDDLTPLPSRWNPGDSWGSIEFLEAGRSLKFIGPRSHQDRDHEAAAVRADYPMPAECGIFYYEVQVLYGKRDDTTIAVGFATKAATMSRPVGWEGETWGYHGDDGRCFAGQSSGRAFGPTFSTGDVVGCGVNFRDHTAFFTKNGVKIGVAFHDVTRTKLFPAISLKKPGEHIMVNFGQAPFVYDIDDMMREQRSKVQNEIEKTDISRLEPGMSETDLIQALVLQFLQHDGYVETARAFAEDIKLQKEALNLDPNVTVDGVNIEDDEDANNRQKIRKAILEGDIDRALKYTQAYYPPVFEENEDVHFKLCCRKFIEMVRKTAQLRSAVDTKMSNGHGPGSSSVSQDMDVDLNGGDNMTWNENSNMDADTQDVQFELLKLEQEMLSYGQSLGAKYASDPRISVTKALGEIWALVAYANPLMEKNVSYLLDKKGRGAVAEELNSAILASLGKSSQASIEKLYAQTSVLLEDLGADGSAGAFVSVQDVVDSIKAGPRL